MPKQDLAYLLLSLREDVRGLRFLLDAFGNWYDFALLWIGVKDDVTLVCNYPRCKLKTVSIDAGDGLIRIVYRNRPLLFRFASRKQLGNAMRNIYQCFIQEQYGAVRVRNRTVVDIGANNGDSAIYFVANGASKVYAYEPYPRSFGQARGNIRLNGMQKKVRLANEAVGARAGEVSLDPGYESVSNSMLEESRHGKRIRVTTLDRIVAAHRLRNAVLKVDCEGSEYGIFSGASDASLACFDQVAIEYHFGYERLVKRLMAAGFRVSYTEPKATRNAETNGVRIVYGDIYARR